MNSLHTSDRALALERCPRPACTGRAYAMSPCNAHTPGP